MKDKQLTIPITVKTVAPHQLAWLRRVELENGNGVQVWEKPDGTLFRYHGKFPLRIAIFTKPKEVIKDVK